MGKFGQFLQCSITKIVTNCKACGNGFPKGAVLRYSPSALPKENAMTRLPLRRPDDWHLHLRDGAMLKAVLPETARDFARAIIMPNLVPPVVTGADAVAYRTRIMDVLPEGADFTPLMTLYLTEQTDPDDVALAYAAGLITAIKLYPAGATTNSSSGVRDFDKVRPVLEKMAEIGLPLCVHGEVTTPEIDIFDREAVFIETVLDPIRRATPGLKVTLEHVTTSDAVDYVMGAQGEIAATITTHHLMINRNHLLVGGIRPHYYCLPIAKRESHRQALVNAATSGHQRFFLGTDSAPHTDPNKLSSCGCAGVFSATNTMACLAHVFEAAGALDKLEAFASLNGPAHYGLPVNEATITLEKHDAPTPFPDKIATGEGPVTLFDPGHPLLWRVA
ncbi:MAG: dihydroorotase [Dinoroseobacter sp.]